MCLILHLWPPGASRNPLIAHAQSQIVTGFVSRRSTPSSARDCYSGCTPSMRVTWHGWNRSNRDTSVRCSRSCKPCTRYVQNASTESVIRLPYRYRTCFSQDGPLDESIVLEHLSTMLGIPVVVYRDHPAGTPDVVHPVPHLQQWRYVLLADGSSERVPVRLLWWYP